MADLPASTGVVVIGCGIMGACAAYHLAASGADVTVLERDTIGAGSTGKSAGGFRAQFSDELNIRMAVENIRRLERFEAEFDTDIGLKQWGYLYLPSTRWRLRRAFRRRGRDPAHGDPGDTPLLRRPNRPAPHSVSRATGARRGDPVCEHRSGCAAVGVPNSRGPRKARGGVRIHRRLCGPGGGGPGLRKSTPW